MWKICRTGTYSREFVSWVEVASMVGSSVAVSLMGRNIAPQALHLTAEAQGFDLGRLDAASFALVAGLQLEQILVAILLGLALVRHLLLKRCNSTSAPTAISMSTRASSLAASVIRSAAGLNKAMSMSLSSVADPLA